MQTGKTRSPAGQDLSTPAGLALAFLSLWG
jgi:hypothetical protein